MHEYRRFVQQHLDGRRWKPADLMRASGLSRQLISTILNDDRDYLGQMPDDSTMKGIADGFGIPVEWVRTAAARSLVGYVDDGGALTLDLQDVHIDVLLNEIRRRVNGVADSTQQDASAEVAENQKTRGDYDLAARDAGVSEGRRLREEQDRAAELSDDAEPTLAELMLPEDGGRGVRENP